MRRSTRDIDGQAARSCRGRALLGVLAMLAIPALALYAATASRPLSAQGTNVRGTDVPQSTQPAPAYSAEGQLLRPQDYREWVYLTSGLGMTYGPAQAAAGRAPMFDNVFVTRAAYREFLRSGTWPDATMFVLEIRRSATNVSINNGGQTQGEQVALEAAVKDRSRFSANGGWRYFSFDGPNGLLDAAAPLPQSAACYACHANNTAVDNTFVQFYPTLFEIAKQHDTIKPSYDPTRKL